MRETLIVVEKNFAGKGKKRIANPSTHCYMRSTHIIFDQKREHEGRKNI